MLELSQEIQDQATQQSASDLQQPRNDLQPTSQNPQQSQQADTQAQGGLSQDKMTGQLQVQGVEPLQLPSRPIDNNQYGFLWLLIIPALLLILMVKLMRNASAVARGRDFEPTEQLVETEKSADGVEPAVDVSSKADSVTTPKKQPKKQPKKTSQKSKSKKKKR
jgi:hypothetical protein